MAHTDVASNFQRTVKNLLRMKPKPHDEAKAEKEKGRDTPAPSSGDKKPTSSAS